MKYFKNNLFFLYWICVIALAISSYVYFDDSRHVKKLNSYDGVNVYYSGGYTADIRIPDNATDDFLDVVISHLKRMYSVPWIYIKNVDNLTREQISDLCTLKDVLNLSIEAKSISGKNWNDLDKKKHSLLFLTLKGQGLDDNDLTEIAKITSLRSIVINNANVSIKGIEPLLHLQDWNRICFQETTFHGSTASNVRSNTAVYVLENCDISSSDLHVLQSLKFNSLQICNTPLSSEHLHQIASLESIHSIELSRNGIASIDLLPFDQWLELVALVICNNKISTIPQSLHNCQMLKSLNLSGNELDDDALANFPFLEHLERLNLSNNPIKGTKMEAIKALPNLKFLNLDGTLIDDETFSIMMNITMKNRGDPGFNDTIEATDAFDQNNKNLNNQ